MALTITKQPDDVVPAYSIIDYKIESDTPILYYEVEITINGELFNLELLPNVDNSVEFNINGEVQSMFNSKIYYNKLNNPQDSLITEYPEDIATINIYIKGYETSTTFSSTSTDTLYSFNGVEQYDESFNFHDDYHMWVDGNGKFLNPWEGERTHVVGTPLTIQFFEGIFSPWESKITGFEIHYLDENDNIISITDTVDRAELSDLNYSTTPKIKSIYIPIPDTLDTVKKVKIRGTGCETLIYNLTKQDKRFKPFHFVWTNKLGGTSYYTFTKNNKNIYSINNDTFNSLNGFLNQKKKYNTIIENKYSVWSDYICYDLDQNLKSLWYSPMAGVIEDEELKEIIIDVNNIEFYSRISGDNKIYKIEFEYANKFKVQRN